MRVSKRFGASRNSSRLPAMKSNCHHSRLIWPYRLFAVSFILTAFFQTVSQAQDLPVIPNPSDTLYIVELDDSDLITGRIAEADAETVVIALLDGSHQEVERAQISVIRLASDGRIVRGEFWYNDLGNTRLFYTPTGRALRAGEGYFGTHMIVFPFAALGVTDYVTFTAGAPLFLVLAPLYLGPKVQILRTAKVQASVGTLAIHVYDEFNGIAYGVGTFGSLDRSVTAGFGYGFAGSELAREPVFMLGGEWRITSNSKMLTENYFFSGSTEPIFYFGIRDISRWGNGDIGIALFPDGDGKLSWLPIYGISVAFGR